MSRVGYLFKLSLRVLWPRRSWMRIVTLVCVVGVALGSMLQIVVRGVMDGMVKEINAGVEASVPCLLVSSRRLTAEEVESVLNVMEESRFQYVTAPNPYVTATDGNTTFIGYTGPIYTDFTDRDHGWSGHMISAFCAEEGDPCYEIRKAIEALIIAHNAGPVPVKETYD